MTTNLTAAPSTVSTAPMVATPDPNLPGGLQDKFDGLLGLLMGVAIVAAVAGVIICGILMVLSIRRGDASDHFGRLGMVMIGCLVIGTSGAIVTFAI